MRPLALLLLVACSENKLTTVGGDTDAPTDPNPGNPTPTETTPDPTQTDTETPTPPRPTDTAAIDTAGPTTTTSTVDTGAAGPVMASGNCGSAPSTYAVASPTEPELHILGVYESINGTIDVQIDRETEMVLVLSSYAAVTWNVTTAPGTNITTLVVNGYEPQVVNGFAGAIDVRNPYTNWLGAYAYAWPSAPGGSDTPAVVQASEMLSGITLTSFTGCYGASAFRLQ